MLWDLTDFIIIELVPSIITDVWSDECVVMAIVKISSMNKDRMQMESIHNFALFLRASILLIVLAQSILLVFITLIWLLRQNLIQVQSFPKLEALIVFDHTISLRVIIESIERYLKYWWELSEPNKLLCVLLSVLIGLELIITVKDLRLYVLADALLYRLVILDTQL